MIDQVPDKKGQQKWPDAGIRLGQQPAAMILPRIENVDNSYKCNCNVWVS